MMQDAGAFNDVKAAVEFGQLQDITLHEPDIVGAVAARHSDCVGETAFAEVHGQYFSIVIGQRHLDGVLAGPTS